MFQVVRDSLIPWSNICDIMKDTTTENHTAVYDMSDQTLVMDEVGFVIQLAFWWFLSSHAALS